MIGGVKESAGNYSTCEECGLYVSGETTPLLDRPRSNVNYITIILLIFGLLIGASIGIYLLVEEIRSESDQPFPEFLQISTGNGSVNSSDFRQPKSRIELIEILGPPCQDDRDCTERMKNGSGDTQNNTFHFLVDVNATAYEHLGFDNDCSNCDSNTLVIALSDTNIDSLYSDDQRSKIEELIKYGADNARLTPCCVISAAKEKKILVKFAEKIQSDINVMYNCTT